MKGRLKQAALIAVLTLVLGSVVSGNAQGTTITGPGIEGTVTATIAPTRLPSNGTAPVTLTINIHETYADREECFTTCAHIRTIDLRLDRRVTVDTTGLAVCRLSEIQFVRPREARQKCGRALIGSGTATEKYNFPEVMPFELPTEYLVFNARKRGKPVILVHSFQDLPLIGADAVEVGTGRRLRFRPGAVAAEEVTVQFKIGKSWRYKGRSHSYFNAKCPTGVLKHLITLTLRDNISASEAKPERCTKRG